MPAFISELSIGSIVVDKSTHYLGSPIEWVVAHKSKSHESMLPDNSVILLSKDILTLKSFDAIHLEKWSVEESPNVREQGTDEYIDSAIRLWLNTEGECDYASYKVAKPVEGAVTTNPYSHELGFLSGFSKPLLDILLYKNNYNSLTSTHTNLDLSYDDRVFLLSATEVGFGKYLDKGTMLRESRDIKLDLFKRFNSRKYLKVKPSLKAIEMNKASNIVLEYDEPWFWTLRTAARNLGFDLQCDNPIYTVASDGKLFPIRPSNGAAGIRPAICIPRNTIVKDSGENGIYSFVF